MCTRILTVALVLLTASWWGCEPDRQFVPDTHNGKVPEVINLTVRIDTTATRKTVVKLAWAYDTARYGSDRDKANLKDWDVHRSVGDTTFYQSRGRTLFPFFSDSSNEVQPLSKDVLLFYQINASGVADVFGRKVQYDGMPSDLIQVVIKKK
jgi:hypothetical protein